MGMYTKAVFKLELIDPYWKVFFHAVQNNLTTTNPDHEFFSCKRWRQVVDSIEMNRFSNDIIVDVELKNYDGELDLFLRWISEHIEDSSSTPTYLGWTQYEECNVPTHWYLIESRIVEVIPFEEYEYA
ncbi:hypothetical protein VP5_049 [Vibrio virus VPMCC5]|nr:hypothetical protein VP5_049 [Vibrio virus VPMCC5]